MNRSHRVSEMSPGPRKRSHRYRCLDSPTTERRLYIRLREWVAKVVYKRRCSALSNIGSSVIDSVNIGQRRRTLRMVQPMTCSSRPDESSKLIRLDPYYLVKSLVPAMNIRTQLESIVEHKYWKQSLPPNLQAFPTEFCLLFDTQMYASGKPDWTAEGLQRTARPVTHRKRRPPSFCSWAKGIDFISSSVIVPYGRVMLEIEVRVSRVPCNYGLYLYLLD